MKNDSEIKNGKHGPDDGNDDVVSVESQTNMAAVEEIQHQLKKKPKKGILKPSASFETTDVPQKKEKKKCAQWDEMNIIATLHPADKDYGHMKIDEPPTPFEPVIADFDERDGPGLDAAALADKIRLAAEEDPKGLRRASHESDSDPDDPDETPEQKAQRKEFEMKRKAHYNEFYAAKLAKKLIEEEEDDDEDEEKNETVPSSTSAGTSDCK